MEHALGRKDLNKVEIKQNVPNILSIKLGNLQIVNMQ